MSPKTQPSWDTKKYYRTSKRGSSEFNHPGMILLSSLAQNATSILDLGCGEGTRLNWLVRNNEKTKTLGVDISPLAISIAKKQFPKLNFKVGDLEILKTGEKYDLVYSAFVLEHTNNPQGFIDKAINLTGKGGATVFMAPNYGAPNRRSPNSERGKVKKLISGFFKDFTNQVNLDWQEVKPKSEKYSIIDADTLTEPYLLSLLKYLHNRPVKVIQYSSLWELEPWSWNPRKALFKLLGILRVFPFSYWGPQLLVVCQK